MWNCKDIEKLKRDLPLLDYLKRFNWTARRVGSGQEYVGLCLLHTETHPSFHVNAAKNLFYCHGCGYGGDLIRFVQVYFDRPLDQRLSGCAAYTRSVPAFPPCLWL